MAVEVSSYEEFLTDRHGTNHAIQIFPKLPLDALAKTYLRCISTEDTNFIVCIDGTCCLCT
jgi:hypothetical protein